MNSRALPCAPSVPSTSPSKSERRTHDRHPRTRVLSSATPSTAPSPNPSPTRSLILDALALGIEGAMPSHDQILDAIHLAVRDAIERNPDMLHRSDR
jgi:hypothetical protein